MLAEFTLDIPLLISRWIHIAAVVTAIGGAVFMRFALLPSARDALSEESAAELRAAVRRRWAKFVHAGIALLLITGFFNFYVLAIKPGVDPVYHGFFGPKLLLALVVFFIASGLVARSAGFAKMQAAGAKWFGVLLVLAGVIILLSGILNQLRADSQRSLDAAPPAAEEVVESP